jgi:hypothetical protein
MSGVPTVQRSTAKVNSEVNSACVRSQSSKSEHTGLSGAATRQSVPTVNRSKPQWRADVAHTEQWTVPCPVRYRQQQLE